MESKSGRPWLHSMKYHCSNIYLRWEANLWDTGNTKYWIILNFSTVNCIQFWLYLFTPAEALIMEKHFYKIKQFQKETPFFLAVFYSKLSSISLIKHRRNNFLSMNIQFTAFCGKSFRAILIEGDILITHWHITLHPIFSNHKWKEWWHSTVSEFFQDSSAIYEWKVG